MAKLITYDEDARAAMKRGIDALADDPLDLWHRSGPLRPRRKDVATHEVRAQALRGPEERVAFGHSGVAALRSEDQAAVAGHEAGLHQDGPNG